MKNFLIGMLVFAGVCAAAETQGLSDRLYEAVRNDKIAQLQALTKTSGPDVKDPRGSTPLMYAAANGSLQAVKMLVEAHADVNAKNDFDITPLMLCAIDEAKVRYLIAHGADVKMVSRQGRTALLVAAGTEGNSEIVKLLVEKGANVNGPNPDPETAPIVAAAGANDTRSVRFLLDHGAVVAGPAGGKALMSASGHGNLAVMGMLIGRGVPVNVVSPEVTETVKNGAIALGSFTPLILAVANGGPEAVKLLLDHGAKVNAQDVRGMTPLMLVLALDRPDSRVVKLLVDHGADPTIKSKAGETAADWARKFSRPEILTALGIPASESRIPLQKAAANANPPAASEAVQKSVRLLERTSASFFTSGGCSSCHAQNATSMAVAAARGGGIRVDEAAARARAEQTRASWAPQDQTLMLRMDAPGAQIMVSFGLLQFEADGVKGNRTTDAMVHNVAAQQQVAGNWHVDGIARPPMSDGDFTLTATGIRSLAFYGPEGRKAEFSARIARAAAWLRRATPVTQEDRNMQMLGLKWAGADAGTLDKLAKALISMRQTDGGWSQTRYLGSDAYATGQTLWALKEAGIRVDDPNYRAGVEYLLRTQMADGSWHVVSRSPKFQPYFQSGFPYDHDQWVSMAATAWSTMALAYTLPESKVAGLR